MRIVLASNTDISAPIETSGLHRTRMRPRTEGRMNYLVVGLGGLLIAIGFAIVVQPANLPGITEVADPHLHIPSRNRQNPPDAESRRRTLVRLLVGFGVIALGG